MAMLQVPANSFAWSERRGLMLATIRPFDVAAWVQELGEEHSTPGVKQQLAAVRMLFDWLITGQVLPTNPAASVRGPKYVVATGKTPVLDGREWRKLLDAISADTVRDRALIAPLTYSFARVGAALKLKGGISGPVEPAGNFTCTKKAARNTGWGSGSSGTENPFQPHGRRF